MKLLDVMKAYNKAVLRENAKLKNIYNTLIREAQAEGFDAADDVISECEGPGCEEQVSVPEDAGGEETNEGQSVAQFFGSLLEGDDEENCPVCEEQVSAPEDAGGEETNEGQSVAQFFGSLLEGDDEENCPVCEEDELDGNLFNKNLKKAVGFSESEEDQENEKREEAAADEDFSAEPDSNELDATEPASSEGPGEDLDVEEPEPEPEPEAEGTPVEEDKQPVIRSAKEFFSEEDNEATNEEDGDDDRLCEAVAKHRRANRRLFS